MTGNVVPESNFLKANNLENDGYYSEAIKVYSELVKYSNDPRHWIAYGGCLQKLKHWKQSVIALEKGIALKPHYCEGDARLLLADSYMMVGDKNKAIAQWKICSEMEPEYPSYEQVMEIAKKNLAINVNR
tara:strand:+ start:1086 stop:1475 length:390 start_codon:yes stop_codon:yes gene_type:complete